MTRFTASLVNHEGPEKSGPSAFCGGELFGGLNLMGRLGPDLRVARVPDVSDCHGALLAPGQHLSRFTTVPGRDTGRACWVSRAGTVSGAAQPRLRSVVPGRDIDTALLATSRHQSRHTRVPGRDTDTALLASDHHRPRCTTVPGRDTGRAWRVSRAGTESSGAQTRFHSSVPGRDADAALLAPGQHLSQRARVPGRDTLCACWVSRLGVPGRDTDTALLASDQHLSRFTTVPGRDTGLACWVSRAGTVSVGAQPRLHSSVPGRDTDTALLASDQHLSRCASVPGRDTLCTCRVSRLGVPGRDTDTALLASDQHLSRFTTVPGRDTDTALLAFDQHLSRRASVPGRDNEALVTPRSARRLQS